MPRPLGGEIYLIVELNRFLSLAARGYNGGA